MSEEPAVQVREPLLDFRGCRIGYTRAGTQQEKCKPLRLSKSSQLPNPLGDWYPLPYSLAQDSGTEHYASTIAEDYGSTVQKVAQPNVTLA